MTKVHGRVGICLLLLFASACGGASHSPDSTAGNSEAGGGEAVIDWSMPVGRDALAVKTAADANLPFNPLVPSDALGSPLSIQVTPESYPIDHTQIAWVYGGFDVTEEVVDSAASGAEWSDLVSQEPGCTASPGDPALGSPNEASPVITCHFGGSSFVRLNSGVNAFANTGSASTSVNWLMPIDSPSKSIREAFASPALEITVIGPSGTLSVDQATQLANEL